MRWNSINMCPQNYFLARIFRRITIEAKI